MSNKVKLEEGVKDSIKGFQKGEVGPNSWIVFGYKGKRRIIVVGSGEGGVSELKKHFVETECRYGLIRKEWKVELANTVKFAFLSYTPESTKPMRKAMLSIHRGQVKDILSPTHVTLEATQMSEVNEKEIHDKFGFSSGTKVHVTTKSASSPKLNRGSINRGVVGNVLSESKSPQTFSRSTPTRSKPKPTASPSQKSKALKFADGDAVTDAIASVKQDSDETNWMLATYDGDKVKKLKLLASGTGGVSEMISNLDTEKIFYGYFRVTEKYDKSITVKFGYLKVMSQNVNPIKRAKVSTHRGFIISIFSPSHVEFDIGDPSEIDEKSIMEKFGKASGTHSNVTEKKETLMASKMRTNKKVEHHVNVEKGKKMTFVDEDAFKNAIKDVRNDDSDVDWMSASYVKKNKIGLLGSGTGGLSALLDTMEEKQVNFGFFRTVEQVDNSETVKFVFVKWQPSNISPMLKADVSTKKGVIDELFTPWHVDFFIESKDEISDELVKEKVSAAAGTKINQTEGRDVVQIGGLS